jgi:hypothetical protein
MPLLRCDGVLTLRCVNHPEIATMEMLRAVWLLEDPVGNPRLLTGHGMSARLFRCRVCGYCETYDAQIVKLEG